MTRRRKIPWPDWWAWDLVLSDHLERRMEEREFSEVDVRGMIANGRSFRPSSAEGRFIVECRWKRRTWSVVVEPGHSGRKLIVVTTWMEE